MSSSDDNFASHCRRNPHRTCRPVDEVLAKSHTPASWDKVSILHSNKNKKTEDLHPARSCGLRKTRNDKQKPQSVNRSACPDSLPKSARQKRRVNGRVSPASHEPEPKKCPPAKAIIRSRKGRTKSHVEPCEKADVPTSSDVACFKRLESSEPAASAESHKTGKAKRTCSQPSKKKRNHVSPGLFTRIALTPQKQKISRHTKTAQRTPKRGNVQLRPLLSSTPNSDLKSPNGADSSCSPCHQDVAQSSPGKLSSPDVTPSRKCKTERLTATGRPAGCKKRNVQERPGSSRPPKCHKSENFLTESLQKEPSVETPPTSIPKELDQSMTSDLSIELSLQEELQPLYHSLSLHEEDQDNEDEELPSFLRQDNEKPSSISEGLCVWCKLRKYPYWPAVVKSVNHKSKKASIVFIDGFLIDQKRIKKGFSVSLRTLKPFNCEEYGKLVAVAKEKYGSAITWSLEIISDYKIRIGCGSFVGSLIEYCAADISCPGRRRYADGTSILTFPSQEILSEQKHDLNNSEDIVLQEHDDHFFKKVLPDRAKAARNRANERLVEFIVNRRRVEKRLLAVINGQESSHWMRALQNPPRRVVDVYLEDEGQVDKVYRYLNEVCDSSPHINACLEKIQADRISLILDVLLPEAIIHAIAGVHKLSLEKAEEKYRSGPCFSNRERQEFDMMIEQQMKLKEHALRQKQ